MVQRPSPESDTWPANRASCGSPHSAPAVRSRSHALAGRLQELGCDALHVSSGGLHPAQRIPVGPGYQVPLARAIKAAVRMPVVAVGLITGYEQAETIVATGDADLIALARTILYDPRWPWHAAAHLGAHVRAPSQYLRCEPARLRGLFETN